MELEKESPEETAIKTAIHQFEIYVRDAMKRKRHGRFGYAVQLEAGEIRVELPIFEPTIKR